MIHIFINKYSTVYAKSIQNSIPLELLARRYDIHENIVWIFTEVERNLVFRLFTQKFI